MSLDIYLMSEPIAESCRCECGHQHTSMNKQLLYEANITHNLGRMAKEAGLYEALWSPDELGAEKACDLIDVLRKGLKELKSDPEKYKQFNASNGWGTYEHFIPFVEKYLNACIVHHNATIEISK